MSSPNASRNMLRPVFTNAEHNKLGSQSDRPTLIAIAAIALAWGALVLGLAFLVLCRRPAYVLDFIKLPFLVAPYVSLVIAGVDQLPFAWHFRLLPKTRTPSLKAPSEKSKCGN